MHRWWDGDPSERFWIEITDREDLGPDLAAPQTNDNGDEYWSYSMVREVRAGDIVFHYHKPAHAITAVSRAIGTPWEANIIWAAHGTVARDAGVSPYSRPGWRMGLEQFQLLAEPVTLDELRHEETALRAMVEGLGAQHGRPVYFPLAFSDRRPVRPAQGYLAKLPEVFVAYFAPLADAATALDTGRTPTVDAAPERRPVGMTYRPANEDFEAPERDAFQVDPALVERGLKGHAATQNALAEFLKAQGIEPRSPRPDEPDFDLAWEVDGEVFVAEVKSTTASNEEKQLRLGLGQVLRYRHLLAAAGRSVHGALVAEREPLDERWLELCDRHGVVLCWTGDFSGLHGLANRMSQ